MAIDWVTKIVFLIYADCGKILAYDLNRSFYATVYDDNHDDTKFIATYPSEGYKHDRLHLLLHKQSEPSWKIRLLMNSFYSFVGY